MRARRISFTERLWRLLCNKCREFWDEDNAPRLPKRDKEREKDWRALEISQKRSHMLLGVLVTIFSVCFLRAVYTVSYTHLTLPTSIVV